MASDCIFVIAGHKRCPRHFSSLPLTPLAQALTIGDAYIAMSGLFNARTRDDDEDELHAMSAEGRSRRHAQNARAIVSFAMAMIETINGLEVPKGLDGQPLAPLSMRIGIHVGPLTAGVIGAKRLRYDIWGTAFNTAVQLESSGVPGEVCVSADVLRHLGGAFDAKKHATVKLKATQRDGSNAVDSYVLSKAPRPNASGRATPSFATPVSTRPTTPAVTPPATPAAAPTIDLGPEGVLHIESEATAHADAQADVQPKLGTSSKPTPRRRQRRAGSEEL